VLIELKGENFHVGRDWAEKTANARSSVAVCQCVSVCVCVLDSKSIIKACRDQFMLGLGVMFGRNLANFCPLPPWNLDKSIQVPMKI
jgi:hypothetical protein